MVEEELDRSGSPTVEERVGEVTLKDEEAEGRAMRSPMAEGIDEKLQRDFDTQEMQEVHPAQEGSEVIAEETHAEIETRQRDSEEREEDQILIPSTANETHSVIDLTDSLSPESKDEEITIPTVPSFRRKPSGFFSNGTLAREQRQQGHFESAASLIRQLGQRRAGPSSKVLAKPSTGFRKKDPIFSQARKSLAKGIAHSKVDDILSSLKRHVKKTLQTPFIDDMLKKRVALAKVLADDTPEEEIQIRHLREILKRSKSSLRPARRQLKEQERLAHEAKMLRRRAMGIMGRQPFPPKLSVDQDDFVLQTYNKQGKIAQMVGAGVEARDIAKLKPGQWLNDEVMNFYTKLILKRSDEAVQNRAKAREAKKRLADATSYISEEERVRDITAVRDVKKIWNGIWNVWTFTSFFWEKLTNGGYSGVRQWTRKVDIFTKDRILLPINMGNMHWVCAAINMRQCRFEYYDSMHGRNRKVFTMLREYLLAEYADKKKESEGPLLLSGWKNYYSKQSPIQSNGFDCGVFASMTIEQLSRRSPADGELKDELNVETIVSRSRELAEQKVKSRVGSNGSDSDEEDDVYGEEDSIEEEEEEEWNFTQEDMPYLRRRMVYEIAKTTLMDE